MSIGQKRGAIIILALLFGCVLTLPGVGASAEIGLKFYGYFSSIYENTGEMPDGSNDPGEIGYPHFNLMGQSSISDNFRIYMNLAGSPGDDPMLLEMKLKNYWGEYTYRDYLKFRFGLLYRRFDLFNEKLDAVPTYLGIEPPELFDGDHLMLPRTTNLMIHGNLPVGNGMVSYAFQTGNSEVVTNYNPVSIDLRYSPTTMFIVGTSAYWANEKAGSPIGIGDGPPTGGIYPWMASDKYNVMGAYAEAHFSALTLEVAYWKSNHEAVRDPNLVVDLYNTGTRLTKLQQERMGLDAYSTSNNISDIKTDGTFEIDTYYLRAGYDIPGGTIPGISWELIPYLFWDYYSNPEVIGKKKFGGDNEAGISDDGKFSKSTFGISIKPVDNVAIKLDGSSHMYKWTDLGTPGATSEDVHYEEFRFDVSYFFK